MPPTARSGCLQGAVAALVRLTSRQAQMAGPSQMRGLVTPVVQKGLSGPQMTLAGLTLVLRIGSHLQNSGAASRAPADLQCCGGDMSVASSQPQFECGSNAQKERSARLCAFLYKMLPFRQAQPVWHCASCGDGLSSRMAIMHFPVTGELPKYFVSHVCGKQVGIRRRVQPPSLQWPAFQDVLGAKGCTFARRFAPQHGGSSADAANLRADAMTASCYTATPWN